MPATRLKRWWVRLGALAAAGAVALLVAHLVFAHRDRQHAAFYQTGKSLGAFLHDYCQALKAGHAQGDAALLLALYSQEYDSRGRGRWEWSSPREVGGMELQALVAQPAAAVGRHELGLELTRYLRQFEQIVAASCKIDLVEATGPVETTLTAKLVVDGTRPGRLVQDRTLVRLRVAREATDGVGHGWRIRRDELVEAVRVSGTGRVFEALDATQVGVDYVHRRDPQLDPRTSPLRFQLIQHAPGGLSAADYDADGRPDLFFADGVQSRLFRNVTQQVGEPRFRDVTADAGLSGIDRATSALFADLDGDGDRDLFVTRYLAPGRSFENLGDGTFRDSTERSGLGVVVPAVAATALDYDRDGLLDLYLAVYGNAFEATPRIPFLARNGVPNRLFHNEGGGRFRDVTAASGTGDTGWSLAAAAGDLDGDGLPDIFVANDFGRKSFYRNRGDGTFSEQAREAGLLDFSGGMGVAIGDFDGDGSPDVYTSNIQSNQRWFGEDATLSQYLRNVVRTRWAITDLFEYLEVYRLVGAGWRELGKETGEGNSLFRNRGDGTFEELDDSHANQAGWGWSVAFFDFDNDTDLDLYAANGWISNRPDTDL